MSVSKSESLLRRDARAFCNKRHQRTIWEARRNERRTNQQLERELRHLERSRSYRERELDRDQVAYLNNFVEIFQKQCDIVAQRKSQAVDIDLSIWKSESGVDDDASQYDGKYEYYSSGYGQDTMTVTTSDQLMTEQSGMHEKVRENQEIPAVEPLKRTLLHRDASILPIIDSPSASGRSSPKFSSHPNSPWPTILTPSEGSVYACQQDAGDIHHTTLDQKTMKTIESDQDSPRSLAQGSEKRVKAVVAAPVHRRRLSPLGRDKIAESHFRAESPSSKNSTIYVSDMPDLGGSLRDVRFRRRAKLPPTSKAKLKATGGTGRNSTRESQRRQDRGMQGDQGMAAEEATLNTKFMMEFEEASKNAMDPCATGADIETIRKQFLVNTLAKKLKISALRSGHFAELDDIRKKIERRRKCVEGILEQKRKEREANDADAAQEESLEDGPP